MVPAWYQSARTSVAGLVSTALLWAPVPVSGTFSVAAVDEAMLKVPV